MKATDWPHVETDMEAWREWAEAAEPEETVECSFIELIKAYVEARKRGIKE